MMAANEHKQAMLMGELLSGLLEEALPSALASIPVADLDLDSRCLQPGYVFVAYRGHVQDGRDFIDEAINKSVVAIIAERDVRVPGTIEKDGVPIIAVGNLSQKISEISGRLFSHPSLSLPVVAVTGTNGKTSCTQLMMQLLDELGYSCGFIGTLGASINGISEASSPRVINTTPDAISVQRTLAQWVQKRVDFVAMEASSHGLDQGRIGALNFDVALFTNLTRDHIDYHGSMQAYAEAKAKLFQQPGLKIAVLNSDDAFSETLAHIVANDVETYFYSAKPNNKVADVWIEVPNYHANGVAAVLHSPWGELKIDSPLLGSFNLSNLLGVITVLGSMSYPLAEVAKVIPRVKTITGRMERVTQATDIQVVVDYAHTPDALEQALIAMRLHSTGKLWCVFGCGGERDQGKRPLMGEVVQRYADHCVVTSDNPRSEPASKIINDIVGEAIHPSLIEEDRAKAIEYAIANASPGDLSLIHI